jgi:hypothetical protein
LEANLDCSAFGSTALTVEGPACLDLNGFDVICTPEKDGIIVRKEGAKTLNGAVSGGSTGIRLRDEGNHRVMNMRVLNCSSNNLNQK